MADTKFSDADNLDNDALLKQLGGAVDARVKAPKVLGSDGYGAALGAAGAPAAPKPPVSTTMPVGGAPVAAQLPAVGEAAAATAPAQLPAPRRGSWGNLNLDAPTQTNLNQFHGYNDERALAGTDDDSTKDALRRWLGGQNYSLAGQTKDQIDAHFEGQRQSAQDYGLDIRDIQGDKMLINTKERGPEWIDFIEGAGGDNPAFAYQSDYDNVGNAALVPDAPSLGQTALAGAVSGAGGEKSAQQKIQDEIAALIAGKGSPVEEDALLEQLQG